VSIRVAIDVTTAVTQRAGIARYTRELVRSLAALPDGPELRPFYIAPREDIPLGDGLHPLGVRQGIYARYFDMMARHALHRPAGGPWDGAQVYHAEVIVYPPVRKMPVVTTVHDLSYMIYPRFHTRLYGSYLRLLTPTMVRGAQMVIAVSESTKRDLVERTDVPAHNVRVIYPGVGSIFRQPLSPERVAEVRTRYGLTDGFILSVGTLEPRKNLHGTLQAYRSLRARLPDAPPLILIGGSGWRLDEQRLLPASEAAYVRRLGYVPDEDLAALYASCSAFVYPSLYEGFGSPVAEALTLGAPTLTSNVSSLPEVAGDAAVLVNPRDPEEIATALERILMDSALGARLRAAGPIQVNQFLYDRCASETMRVYEEAIERYGHA